MPCNYCRHFNETSKPPWSGDIVEDVKQTKGQCTLTPTWEEVTGLHYCSQFRPDDVSVIGFWWRSMHEASDEASKQRKLKVVAEKQLKELRKQIKEGKTK